MAKGTMKDIVDAVSAAIDGPDNIGNVGGPTSDKEYGPGGSNYDSNERDYIKSQQMMQGRGTDSDINNYELNRGRMGLRMNEDGDMGAPLPQVAHSVNQAWTIYNKAPTDMNQQRLTEALRAAHIPDRAGDGGYD